MHVLQPGDIGHIGPGTYAGIYITVSGAPELPISFVGSGAKIVEPSQQGINFSSGVHHVNVSGFDVVSQQKNGIFLSSGTHHLVIKNNVVHDSPVASTMTGSPRYHYGIVFMQSSGLQNRSDYNLSYGGGGSYYSDNLGNLLYGTHNIAANPLLKNVSTDPDIADFRSDEHEPGIWCGQSQRLCAV